MFILVSPIARWILLARYWLFGHGYFWLGIHLPQIVRGVFVYSLPLLWLLEMAREIRYLWILPKRASRLATAGQNEKALDLMRRSLRAFTPILGSRPLYFTRAYKLGQMLENCGRYGEACEVWEEVTKRRGMPPGFEADVRGRWADDLENEGDARGAARQRDLAAQKLDVSDVGADENWSLLLERGKRERDANHFPQALELFERSLSARKIGLLKAQRVALEAEIACHVSLAAHQGGDIARAESAARQTIAGADSPFLRAQGWRSLANALSTGNRLDEALEALRAALAEAEKHGDEQVLADTRAQYALLLMNTGQIEAALTECEAAIAMGLNASRMALHTAASCHNLRGDYAAARDWLERARRGKAVGTPAVERQLQGLFDMEGADIEMNATKYGGQDRAQVAWDLLQRAKPGLRGFERLLFWHRAAETSALALLGQSDAARAAREPLAQELENYPDDTATQSAIWTHLAHISMIVGDWEAAKMWWQRYLDAPFARPIYRAEALGELGVCLRQLGDDDGALACWQQVEELGFAVVATERARSYAAENR